MKKNFFIAVGWVALAWIGGAAWAGTLTDSGMELPKLAASALAWGDYDGDGDPDLVVAGETVGDGTCLRITRVFRNEGGGLTAVQDLVGVSYGAVAWGDYDGDGDSDLALSGWDPEGNEVAVLYRLNDAGVFEEDLRQSALVGVRYSALAWGDYDGDGDLDLIVCGMEENGTPSTRVYGNEAGRLVEDASQTIVYVSKGSVAWGDYDRDGDVDLAISGFDGNGARTAKIYRNDPTGTLREDNDSLSGLSVVGQLVWGDLDGDGDLDLAVSGWNSFWQEQFEVVKNDPPGLLAGTFSLSFKRITGALAWGDTDNDGGLDLAAAGRDRFSQAFAFVLNNEGGVLTEDADQDLTGLRRGSVGWADYDDDRTLDLLVLGEEGAALYENDEAPNERPSAPEKLRGLPFVTGRRVTFSWGSASDAETPAEGLTYALRVGTSEGGSDVFSGAVGVGPGRVGNLLYKALLRRLNEGRYFWNVQAVDSGFERSAWWSQDEILQVEKFVGSDQELLNLQWGAMAWGDYDNDGDPDLVLSGRDVNGNARTILYENVLGILRENMDSTLKGVQNGDLAWGDYDRDGDLDLALCGEDAYGNPFSLIYRNEPTGTLVPDGSFSDAIAQVKGGSLDWGDYDNDGDLDLVVVGQTKEIAEDGFLERVAVVYRNDSGVLVEDETQVQGVADGMARWGDYDGDGDLDLAITGGFRLGEFLTRIYESDPAGHLAERFDLVGLITSALAWGDYDGDGDLDLAICGLDASGTSVSKVYKNDGGTFSEDETLDLAGVDIGSLAWGDYDNDGDLDLVLSGRPMLYGAVTGFPILRIYENDGGSLAERAFQVPAGLQNSLVGWCDVDGDGDLDLVASGYDGRAPASHVYDNLEALLNLNAPPEPPSGLEAVPEGSSVMLRWEGGSDDWTPVPSLSYDLRVGMVFDGKDLVIRSGKVALGFGNAGSGRSLMLQGLESGSYFWSVRTVDHGFERSAWSAEARFVVDTIAPTVEVMVDPPVVGIGQDVTVIVTFSEGHSGMNTAVSPKVTFAPSGGVEVVVEELTFVGSSWTGKATVSQTFLSGTAVVSVEGAEDLARNVMAPDPRAAEFRIDTEVPVVERVVPDTDQTGVRRSSNVTVAFSEDMDRSSIVAEHFKLMRAGQEVAGTFSYDAEMRMATFDPAEELEQDAEYEAWVSSSVRDSVGNRMAEDFRWGFRTAKVVAVWPGGTLRNEAETVSLFVPPNALDADQEIALREVPEDDLMPLPEGYTAVGAGIRFEPVLALRKPATLRFRCDDGGGGTLAVFRREDSDADWERLGGTTDVLQQGVAITTVVRRLGTFAVFAGIAPSGAGGISSMDCQPRAFSPKGGGLLKSETDISFELGAESEVTIEVYDEVGRLTRVLTKDERMGPGHNAKAWDGKDDDGDVVHSGMYIVLIRVGEKVQAKKTVVVWNN